MFIYNQYSFSNSFCMLSNNILYVMTHFLIWWTSFFSQDLFLILITFFFSYWFNFEQVLLIFKSLRSKIFVDFRNSHVILKVIVIIIKINKALYLMLADPFSFAQTKLIKFHCEISYVRVIRAIAQGCKMQKGGKCFDKIVWNNLK